MQAAPFFHNITHAPEGGKSQWRTCADGVCIRITTWKEGTKGTVLIFPGRTEFIEKYSLIVKAVLDRSYCAAVVDWRGQGLSDRLAKPSQLGHVKKFNDYQLDVQEVLKTIEDQNMPAPEVLIAHSMGGAIGLRALHEGLPVKKAIFSAPMWGIHLSPMIYTMAKLISYAGVRLGFSKKFAPNTNADNYVQINPFRDNLLTADYEMYNWFFKQLETHPELALGGPSLNWLHEAFIECTALQHMAAPKQDCLCFLGGREAIVSPKAIQNIMDKWQNGQLVYLENVLHEILMETQDITDYVWERIDAFLAVE